MCQSYESRPTTNQNLVEVEKQVQQSREKNYVSDDPEQLTSGGGNKTGKRTPTAGCNTRIY